MYPIDLTYIVNVHAFFVRKHSWPNDHMNGAAKMSTICPTKGWYQQALVSPLISMQETTVGKQNIIIGVVFLTYILRI